MTFCFYVKLKMYFSQISSLLNHIYPKKFSMKKLFLLSFLFISITLFAQTNVVIVPKPVSLEMHSGNFNFNAATTIIAEKGTEHEANMLNVYLQKLYGFKLPVKSKIGKGNFIVFKLLPGTER